MIVVVLDLGILVLFGLFGGVVGEVVGVVIEVVEEVSEVGKVVNVVEGVVKWLGVFGCMFCIKEGFIFMS